MTIEYMSPVASASGVKSPRDSQIWYQRSSALFGSYCEDSSDLLITSLLGLPVSCETLMINHKRHGGHRDLSHSPCPPCPLWWSLPVLVEALLDELLGEVRYDLPRDLADHVVVDPLDGSAYDLVEDLPRHGAGDLG